MPQEIKWDPGEREIMRDILLEIARSPEGKASLLAYMEREKIT